MLATKRSVTATLAATVTLVALAWGRSGDKGDTANIGLIARRPALLPTLRDNLEDIEIPGVAPFIGFTGLAVKTFAAPFTPCTEVGWRLARDAWGHGYATEAARAAVAFGFGELGLAEIVSYTTVANARSIAVMERLGMRRDIEFDHPLVAPESPVRRHVLYRLAAGRFPRRG